MITIVTSNEQRRGRADDVHAARHGEVLGTGLEVAARPALEVSPHGLLGALGRGDQDRSDDPAEDDRHAEAPLDEELLPVMPVAGQEDARRDDRDERRG